jgi:DMSO/TMAO reductase YedYZ molybdopterin-dependent catalytic subunit
VTSVASAEWTLKISDASGNIVGISYSQLLEMPQTKVNADLYCYGLQVTGGEWGGVRVSDLLAQANVDSTGGAIQFSAQDGYSITIPLETALKADTIIAYEKDDVPLQETLRLVLPEANGAYWISMITSMNISSVDANANLSGNFVRSIMPHITPTPQQSQAYAQPTATPKSEPTVEPSAPPASTTPESQQNITKQIPSPAKQGMPIEFFYGLAIVVGIGTVAGVGFVAYRRKSLR